ncbi:glycoside hydrolase family 26 protein [Streptomyces avidinii]
MRRTARRGSWIGGGLAVLCSAAVLFAQPWARSPGAVGPGPAGPGSSQRVAEVVPRDLAARDPGASDQARAVYKMLADLENSARAGRPGRTLAGQHVEAQNEAYGEEYGDYRGGKGVGYYYKKAADITGRLPAFVEADLGPGFEGRGWGVGPRRAYNKDWPGCQDRWGYVNDVVDLLDSVWSGPAAERATRGGADGPAGPDPTGAADGGCPSPELALPKLDGPSGIVGMSFHQPYPGAPVKDFRYVQAKGAPGGADPGWFAKVVDHENNTPEYRALLDDLKFLADHLDFFQRRGIPVLLRPYHEMNLARDGGFWWSGQDPAAYRELWQVMYHYLVDTRGLHNLIFVWSPVPWPDGQAPFAYYPGDGYVDMVGVDDYTGTGHGGEPFSAYWYRQLARFDKPRVLAESSRVPGTSQGRDVLEAAPWTMWTVWGQALSADNVSAPKEVNSLSDVKNFYGASDRVITGGTRQFGSTVDWGLLGRAPEWNRDFGPTVPELK